MEVSYKNLWKMLIDRNMKKIDFQAAAGLAANTMTRLSMSEEKTWMLDILPDNKQDVGHSSLRKYCKHFCEMI